MQQVKYVNLKKTEELISFKEEYEKYNKKEIQYEDLISIIFSENIYVYFIQDNYIKKEITFIINKLNDIIYVYYNTLFSIDDKYFNMFKKKLKSYNYNPNNFPIYTSGEILKNLSDENYEMILT